jgi:hypothetical protein
VLVWYFSEMAYHPVWEGGLKRGSLRVVLPKSNFDPKVGHGLLNRYLDEFALCDEVGLDIMVNEHHFTSTCLTISVPMALAIIARETKRSRFLSLGTPIVRNSNPRDSVAFWAYCKRGQRVPKAKPSFF